jgi:peptide/nickel transport system permease protein
MNKVVPPRPVDAPAGARSPTTDIVRVRTPAGDAWRRLLANRYAMFGLAILLIEAAIAILGPFFAPYDPALPSGARPLELPSAQHLMGADDLGRDIYSRVLHGARLAFIEGLTVAGLSMGFGVTFGAFAGFYRSLDMYLSRIAEVMLAYPGLLLAIGIVAVIGPGLTGALIAVSIGGIAPTALLTRTLVRSIMNNDYVLAARQVGCRDRRILFLHILPNALSPLVVQGSFRVAIGILSTSGLSFLGLGAQPPTPEWGSMLASGRDLILVTPHVAAFPGIAIAVTVLGFNMLGDGLRDVFDPRSSDIRM